MTYDIAACVVSAAAIGALVIAVHYSRRAAALNREAAALYRTMRRR